MKRKVCLAVMLALVAGIANAGTVLLDATTNNGSFDTAPLDNSNCATTGTNAILYATGQSGGYRAAINQNATLTVPGWSFVFTNGNIFGGINHSNSTPARDGLQSFVMNNSAVVNAKTDAIAVTINPGDTLKWSCSIGLNQLDGTKNGAWNVGLYFDGGSENRILQTQLVNTTGYNDYSGEYVCTGAGATSVQLGFVINVDSSGLGGQAMADAFYLEVVPEPATMILLGLGSLVLRRRK